jgi:hypothetical protein
MSACPKGGQHVPRFPASQENGWIIHYCKKCGTEMNRRPASNRLAVAAAAITITGALTAGCGPSLGSDVQLINPHLTFSGGNTHTIFTIHETRRPLLFFVVIYTQHRTGPPGHRKWINLSKIIIHRSDLPGVGRDRHYNKTGACYQNTHERVYVNGSGVSADGVHKETKWWGPNWKLGKATGDCDVPIPPGTP